MSVPAPQPSSPSTAGAVAACTIIARNYLSYAAILAESYLRHEPGGRFYVLVVDGLPPKAALPDGVHLVAADELGLPAFHDMCFKYDVTELCTAVKPALLSLLLTRYAEPAVAYFDPDILILRPLDELKEALRAADVVLIPHVLDPIPRDGKKPSEQDILIAGAYNLGFVAVRATPEAGRLLAWWGDRLEDGCRVDPAHGLFVDQRWMDLVPSLFPSTAVLRDPTYDVAYWNLHTRMPARGPSGFEVDGRPLAFFHFSGFDPRQPEKLSRHQTRVAVEPGSALAELLEDYAARHERHGHAACSRWTYGYSRFSNGVSVGLVFRHLYLGLDETARRRFGNPFVADGNGSFYGWAVRPQPELGGLNPFLETLYAIRADLPPAFPDHRGASRAAYLRWAREQGAREMDFPAIIVPDPADTARAAAAASATAPGVNVAGYLRNETGIGAVARGYVAAMQSAGVPVALKDFSELSPNRSEDPTLTGFDDVHPHPVNLLCANADEYFVVASHLGDGFLRNRTNVGVWFWELPEFPVDWHDRFAHYDEIWAPTSFIANTLSAVSPIPIVRVPAVLTAEPGGDRDRGRARLGVAEGEFLWLVIFDFHSYFDRKNPLAMVEAFKQAYRPSDPARLVVKCVNSAFDPESRARLDEAARGHRIAIHDGYWSLGEMRDLLSACDGYASLHRSEGLGIPLANAMSLGKPVVATAWSGNTDFMSVGNSFPVRYDVVELPHDVGPYRAGRAWAEPSVDHAAELLRTVSAGGPEVAARAAAGQATIAARYSVEAVGRAVRDRLEVLARRPARPAVGDAPVVAAPNGSAPATPAPATADDFQPALPALDLEKSQFGLLGRWGKRAAALVLRYHAFHQRRVNEILARAIGDAASQLSALSSRVEHGRAEARAGADRALSAVGALEARTRETAAAVHATRGSLEQRLSEADARVARLLTEHEQTAERVRALAEAAGAWRPRVEQELRRTFEHAHGLDLRLDAVGGRLDAVGVRFEGLERGVATNAAALGATQEAVAATQEAVAATQQAVTAAQEAAARSWREHDAAAARTREQAEAATRAACALETRLAQALQSTALQGEELDARLHELRGEIETLRVQAAGDGPGLRAAQARIEDLAARVAHVGYRFAVRPYMGVDPYGATGDLDQPMGYGAGTGRAASAAGLSFEDVFRGPESLIVERQRQYLPLLAGATKVVDLGCGRGEFLGLLAEAGIQAVGVEQDAALVERCRARKLPAVHGDALAYLRTVGASTLDAVFSAQFIEHLPTEQLAELLALARARLREGGLFIAETPNPESFEALKTFHVDLTHQRPIYPQVLLYLCQQEGFRSARIFYPVGGGFTQKSYETSGEYAVVATR